MDGPSHYRAAEKLLSEASYTGGRATRRPVTPEGMPIDPATHAAVIARAQVHATLALAASNLALGGMDDDGEWRRLLAGDQLPDDPAHVDGALDRIAGHALTSAYLDQNGGAI
jgi:hypothetical protein